MGTRVEADVTRRWVANVRNRNWCTLACALGAGLLATVALSGCGNGNASVSGRLTLDGAPLASSERVRVTVMFCPEGGGVPAAALADGDGRYRLSTGAQMGLAPGDYVVV